LTVIFSDGFETGDLTVWTSNDVTTGESNTPSTDRPHHGTYSMDCTTNGGGGTEYARAHYNIVDGISGSTALREVACAEEFGVAVEFGE